MSPHPRTEVAIEWLNAFSAAITPQLLATSFSRIRTTFEGRKDIKKPFVTGLNELRLLQEPLNEPVLQKVYHDLVWLRFCFGFTTKHGKGTAVVYLVPLLDSKCAITFLREHFLILRKLGPLRNREADHGSWEEKRRQETEFSNNDLTVIVIGAGHSGLETAARSKVQPNALPELSTNMASLHPTPAAKVQYYAHNEIHLFQPFQLAADWLEAYASSLELDVWTASTITKTYWNDSMKTWSAEVNPAVKVSFKGSALHSSEFKSEANHIGKKAIVVGCCNSGCHGVDITMYQRSSTFVISTESVAAMLGGGCINVWFLWLLRPQTNGLAKVGFKTNFGIHGAGSMSLYLERGGGYYIGGRTSDAQRRCLNSFQTLERVDLLSTGILKPGTIPQSSPSRKTAFDLLMAPNYRKIS
ncbi:hypothetical protein BDR06DRAFT_969900 [Suillus hirtellus]|nr:hypothetical protein BDR06DRAFT_972206 [Suillus hirtellus]KAG2056921.1 hypothetical protein BDR06DRAFT_969900 [Suillus hirtellus]